MLTADRAGIGMAGACALHCLIAPWLAAVLPLFGAAVASERTETAFLGASLVVSATTLAGGARTHQQWRAIVVFLCGAGLLVANRATGLIEQPLGDSIVLCGACLIAAGHVLNMRCCRQASRSPSCAAPLG